MRTNKAVKECANWLYYCLSIGWSKTDLDGLENLWRRFHNDEGKLFPNNSL